MTKEDILHHFQDINFYYNDCMMYDDLSRMLDELIAENKGEWIPVSEGLPKVGEYVLASIKPEVSNYRVVISKRNNEAFWTDGTVEAWQPLPEPYKAESEDEE